MRIPEWQTLFADYIKKKKREPFNWGVHDCCIFAGEWLYIATGNDAVSKYRDTYHTALEAGRLLQEFGGLAAVADAYLERWETLAMAQVGDIVLLPQPDRPMLAICNGGTIIAPGLKGLEVVPLEAGSIAWKV